MNKSSQAFRFEPGFKDGLARTGTLFTSRGAVSTPCFMPVGTRASVRTLTSLDLENLGAEIILANTYHLMLRPGDELIASSGGLHNFMKWSKPILTDSGGYQILSLEPQLSEEGASFKSTYDGTQLMLTPEKAVNIQNNLHSDIQMVLDVCPPLPAEKKILEESSRLTSLWAKRARKAFLESQADTQKENAQFGIVQGGLDIELRQQSVEEILEIGFEGYAIGGLSVGESQAERNLILSETAALLPETSPRYLMGVGDPLSLITAISVGVDMFDCVLPTRLARHGTALTSMGKLNMKSSVFKKDDAPLDPNFTASPANHWPRSYIRHLLSVGEPAGGRILTLHNLAWILDLLQKARSAISSGQTSELLKEVKKIWQ